MHIIDSVARVLSTNGARRILCDTNMTNLLSSHSLQFSNINMLKNCESHWQFILSRVY
jgi:hypothetical protein